MHQRPFLPHGAQYLLKGIHLSAFLSPAAGCPHAAQPYGAVFDRARQPVPDSSPYNGKRPPHPFSVLSLRQNPASDARHPMICPSCLCHSLPPRNQQYPGAWPSGHPCWRRHPDRCALNWFTAREPSPSAGYPPFYGNTAFSFIFFSALQRNISTSAFFPGTGLTQGPRWTSSRVSVTKSYNDLNYICSDKHISAFLRRSHRFRPIPGGSP